MSLSLHAGTEGKNRHSATQMKVSGNFTPRPLLPTGNNPLHKKLGGYHNWSGRLGRKTDMFPLSGVEPQLFFVQPVAWTLYRRCCMIRINMLCAVG